MTSDSRIRSRTGKEMLRNVIEQTRPIQGTKSKAPQAIRLLQEVAGRHCSHIQKPYTLKEICEHVDGSEYNAELMLQHLLLWCSDYMKLP